MTSAKILHSRGASWHLRERLRLSSLACLALVAVVAGCTSIHSESVRKLITMESEKLAEAKKNSNKFTDDTASRLQDYKNGVADLNRSMQRFQQQDTVLALTLASSQPVMSRTGLDARAFAFRAGLVYLDTQAGLDKAVNQQFEDDFKALDTLAQKLQDSWTKLTALQKQIDDYSHQSGLAAVDASLLAAAFESAGVKAEQVDAIIARGKKVNSALEKLSGLGALDGDTQKAASGYIQELLQLLEAARPSASSPPSKAGQP